MLNFLAIDFGTTKLCAAAKVRGHFTTIQIDQNDINPSDVFLGDQIYVGTRAKKMGERDPSLWVPNIKRLIGRTLNDPLLIEFCKNRDYSIVEVDGNLAIQCSVKGSTKTYFVYDIISEVLNYIVKGAEQSCNCSFDGLMLAIPPAWNENQKTEFIRCARRLSLPHIDIVTETVASCLKAGFKPSKNVQCVMVVDGGGGTFDVTTLRLSKEKGFEVIVTNGIEVGGMDFTSVLLEDVMNQLQILGMDISKLTPRKRMTINNSVEETKITLSSQETAAFEVDTRSSDVFRIQITRENLNNDCYSLFKRCWSVVQTTLEQSVALNAKPESLILCGDGLRVDKLWRSIAGFFSDSHVSSLFSSSVAMGAAIFSSMKDVQKRHYEGDGCRKVPQSPSSTQIPPSGTLMPPPATLLSTVPIPLSSLTPISQPSMTPISSTNSAPLLSTTSIPPAVVISSSPSPHQAPSPSSPHQLPPSPSSPHQLPPVPPFPSLTQSHPSLPAVELEGSDIRPNSIAGFDGSQLDGNQLRVSQIAFPLSQSPTVDDLEEYTVSEKRSYNIYIAKQPIHPKGADLIPIIRASVILPFSSVPLHWKAPANKPLVVRLYEGRESYKEKCRCIRIL